MSVQHPTGPDGPNVDVIAGLRAIADFLQDHPELPVARWASVSLRAAGDDRPARETLAAVAAALGEQAVEARQYGGDVEIRGEFGPAMLRATARVSELVDPAPVAYEPIIAPEYSVKLRRVAVAS